MVRQGLAGWIVALIYERVTKTFKKPPGANPGAILYRESSPVRETALINTINH
jgi:hypothetical protein